MAKNPVSHFEIYADEPIKLADFYTRLFEWSIEPFPGMDYWMIRTVKTDAGSEGDEVEDAGAEDGLVLDPVGSTRQPVALWQNDATAA